MSAPEAEKSMKKNQVFDAEAGSSLVKELRGTFASGKSRSYVWRVSQLNALFNLLHDREQEIVDALRSDLAKPPLETVVYEVSLSLSSVHLTFVAPFYVSYVLSELLMLFVQSVYVCVWMN